MDKLALVNQTLASFIGFPATLVCRWRLDERGQTLVEYSLILAFVASMIIAISVLIGGTNGLIDDIDKELSSALGL